MQDIHDMYNNNNNNDDTIIINLIPHASLVWKGDLWTYIPMMVNLDSNSSSNKCPPDIMKQRIQNLIHSSDSKIMCYLLVFQEEEVENQTTTTSSTNDDEDHASLSLPSSRPSTTNSSPCNAIIVPCSSMDDLNDTLTLTFDSQSSLSYSSMRSDDELISNIPQAKKKQMFSKLINSENQMLLIQVFQPKLPDKFTSYSLHIEIVGNDSSSTTTTSTDSMCSISPDEMRIKKTRGSMMMNNTFEKTKSISTSELLDSVDAFSIITSTLEQNELSFQHSFHNVDDLLICQQTTPSRNVNEENDAKLLLIRSHETSSHTSKVTFTSEKLQAIEYKLCIQEQFSSNTRNFLRYANSLTYEWYTNYGGHNFGIDVLIHLKDSKGRIVHDFPAFAVKTELVYDDGTPTISSTTTKPRLKDFPRDETEDHQEVVSQPTQSEDPSSRLYQMLRDEPILGNGKGSQFFSFRINEVSSKASHTNKKGFKLKVSPAAFSGVRILPGLMEETITVKSKPRKLKSETNLNGGRTSLMQRTLKAMNTIEPTKASDDASLTVEEKPPTTDGVGFDKVITVTPLMASELFSGGTGRCLYCNFDLLKYPNLGLHRNEHAKDCRFARILCPFTEN